MRSECLVLLAKYWEPGHVKTRLAKSLGEHRAAEVHRVLVACSVARFRFTERKHVLAYAPGTQSTREKLKDPNLAGWDLKPQAEGDLGQRMRTVLAEQIAAGADSVVILGADSPHLPLESIERAFRILRERELVLGPSEDGGYYLVGASRHVPPIFEGIPWGTGGVWNATIQQLEASKTRFETLDSWFDVDRPADLERLMSDLLRTGDEQLVVLRRRLQRILSR